MFCIHFCLLSSLFCVKAAADLAGFSYLWQIIYIIYDLHVPDKDSKEVLQLKSGLVGGCVSWMEEEETFFF